MKKICRNLSIVALVVIGITTAILIIVALRKTKDKEIYATDVNFKTMAESIEIYGENKIVVSSDLVNIKPANCTVEPEFLFKKYGQSGEIEIKDNYHKFEDVGKYILICRVKSGESYYVEDRLTIDVVNAPRETTSFYIKDVGVINLYLDESVELEELVTIKRGNNSSIEMIHNERVKYENGIINPIMEGACETAILLKDNNIVICQEITINVKPSVINAEVKLELTLGGEILESNVVEKQYSQFYFDIGYTLVNLDRNQAVECWTESSVVEVVRFNSPTIRLKPLSRGIAIVYVKPVERPDLIFEIIVSII